MKKSKLSLGLVTGFVASLALAGCGSVKAKDNSLLTYTGYDGTSYEIVTEKMYQEYRKDSKVISTFYDKVLEVLIRDLFKSGNYSGSKSYATIEALAKDDVKAAKAKATESAKTNNTSYEKEWESLLSGEGVEDEKELLQKYIYNQEKEVLEEDIYQSLNKADKLKTNWLDGALPYHIRHILAKVDSGASEYTRGTISADQAKKISDAGLALGRANDTFGGVAKLNSEDGSASTYGDVGIVSNKVSSAGSFSMVTEFQLAIYIYDVIYHGQTSTGEKNINSLVPQSVIDDGIFSNIVRVPFDVFRQLAQKENGGLGDVTNLDGIQVGEGEEAVYPRNILWNRYLNHHEPFIITNDTVADAVDVTALTGDMTKDENITAFNTLKANPNFVGAADATITEAGDAKVTGFRKANTVGLDALGTTLVLTDENKNPIFGVRSEYGIHFIIIERSAFDDAGVDNTTLKDYYQAYAPSQAEWNKDLDNKKTYVNYAGFTSSQMVERANAVKDAIKGYDGTYQYNIFSYLMDSTQYGVPAEKAYKAAERFNLEDEGAKQLISEIQDYVTRQKAKSEYDQDEGFKLAWKNFTDKIEQQSEEREKYRRIIPVGCAIGFKEAGHESLYEIGGPCYYGNKK